MIVYYPKVCVIVNKLLSFYSVIKTFNIVPAKRNMRSFDHQPFVHVKQQVFIVVRKEQLKKYQIS